MMIFSRLSTFAMAALFLASALMLAPTSASAQQTYFGEDLSSGDILPSFPNANAAQQEFLDRLTGVGTEDFEDFSTDNQLNDPPITLDFPGFSGTENARLTGSGEIEGNIESNLEDPENRYAYSGSQFFEIDAGNFLIEFSNPVAAFGFFGIDIGDFGEQLLLTFIRAGNNTTMSVNHTVGIDGSTSGSGFFFGVVNTDAPFTAVEFETANVTTDIFAFDDMTIGSVEQVQPPTTVVPEPVSMVLLGSGLVGVFGAARRRREDEEDILE